MAASKRKETGRQGRNPLAEALDELHRRVECGDESVFDAWEKVRGLLVERDGDEVVAEGPPRAQTPSGRPQSDRPRNR